MDNADKPVLEKKMVNCTETYIEFPAAHSVCVLVTVRSRVAGFATKTILAAITKTLGSRSQAVLYASSSIPIWILSMFMGWEPFNVQQSCGKDPYLRRIC